MILAQIPGGPSADALLGPAAQLLAAVAFLIGAVGWTVLKFREQKNGSTIAQRGNVQSLVSMLSEFQGRLDERTTTQGIILDQFRAELATIDKRIQESRHKIANDFTGSIGAVEVRLNERLDRLEQRVDRLTAKP